ncbi:MAG TPA: Hsp20/alpha crystallin family protein [Caulobacterales bacterium]|jgi:HSP20 family protein|nr:Hsp20/alpha crystallin family protein [Caulobacterales bacterium]
MKDLIPWNRSRQPIRQEDAIPFHSLHRDINRLFDDAFRDFGLPAFGASGRMWPSIEVTEHEKDICVTAELSGLDEKDVEIAVEDGVLTIRGEKHTEVDDKERRYTERSYGRFERRVTLPAEVEEERAKATFKNGLLTVTLPKSEREQARSRRIPIVNS